MAIKILGFTLFKNHQRSQFCWKRFFRYFVTNLLNTCFVCTPCSYSHLHLHFFSLKHLWQKICIILCKKAINMLIKTFYVLILIATLLNFKWISKYSWNETKHKIISNGYFIPIVFIILINRYVFNSFFTSGFTLLCLIFSNLFIFGSKS